MDVIASPALVRARQMEKSKESESATMGKHMGCCKSCGVGISITEAPEVFVGLCASCETKAALSSKQRSREHYVSPFWAALRGEVTPALFGEVLREIFIEG